MELVSILIVILVSFTIWLVWITKSQLRLEKEILFYQVEINRDIYMIRQDNETIANELESLTFPKTIKLHWAKKGETK